MIVLLLSVARSEYIELTPKIIDKIIGGSRLVFVKFYSTYCGNCISIAEDFSDASTRLSAVLFAGVNCPQSGDICDKYGVDGFPVLRYYPANNHTGFDYDGPQVVDDFVSFIQNETNIKAEPSAMHNLIKLSPKNWERHMTNNTCGMVMFHMRHCAECQHLRPQVAKLAAIFENDPNITVGTLDCEWHSPICRDLGVEMYLDYDEEEEGGIPPEIHGFNQANGVITPGNPR
jgi:protein disulfide-isomerase A6